MGAGVLRRQEPGVGGWVLERMPGGVRVHVRGEQENMQNCVRGRSAGGVGGVRRRELGGRGRMQLDV